MHSTTGCSSASARSTTDAARRSTLLGVLAFAAAVGAVLAGGRGFAADAAAPPAAGNPILEAFPAAATAAAPAWVTPGTRISYRSAAVPVESGQLWLPEADGRWVDPATGTRRTEQELWGTSKGGEGITQVDVVQTGPGRAILSVSSFATAPGSAGARYGGAVGVVGLPGAGGEYWVSPEAMAAVPDSNVPGRTVTRAPYSFAGVAYEALWLRSVGPAGAVTRVYDTKTGRLVMASSMATAPAGPASAGKPAAPTNHLTRLVLLGSRQVAVPWVAAPAPEWVADVSSFSFAGSLTESAPGAEPKSRAMTLTLTVRDRGLAWLRYSSATSIDAEAGKPATSEGSGVAGPAQLGGLWVPPAGLAALTAGQRLDQDPHTGSAVSVLATDAAQVTLSGGNAAFQVSTTYDRAQGKIRRIVFEDRATHHRVDLALRP